MLDAIRSNQQAAPAPPCFVSGEFRVLDRWNALCDLNRHLLIARVASS